VDATVGGHTVEAYPALVDEGDTVAVRLFADRDEQAEAMWAGTRRLLQLRLPAAARAMGRLASSAVRRSITTSPYVDEADWQHDMLTAVFDHLIDSGGGPVWTAAGFETLQDHVRSGLGDTLREAWSGATETLHRHAVITRTINGLDGPGFAAARSDITQQLDRLVYRGSLSAMGLDRIADVSRYLEAIERRLAKLPDDPVRDRERMTRCRRLEADYDDLRERTRWSPQLEDVSWLLEEFRVATFAQQLGTTQSVSEKRIWTAMAALADR
jgi:ATP-dependent helicase HrpA